MSDINKITKIPKISSNLMKSLQSYNPWEDLNKDGKVDQKDVEYAKNHSNNTNPYDGQIITNYDSSNDVFASGIEYFRDKNNKSGYTDKVPEKYKIENIDFDACGDMAEIYKSIVKSEEDELNKDKQELDAAQAFYDAIEGAASSAVLMLNSDKFIYTLPGGKKYYWTLQEYEANKTIISKQLKSLKEEYQKKCAELKSTKAAVIQAKYENIRETSEYKEYIKNYKPGEIHASVVIRDEARGDHVLKKGYFIDSKGNKLEIDSLELSGQFEKYGSEDQLQMFQYLFETQGSESALNYLSSIKESLNQAQGILEAEKFLLGLKKDSKGNYDYSAVSNHLATLFEGGKDGVQTFLENCINLIENNEELSPLEYKKLTIMAALQEKCPQLAAEYHIGDTVGNVLIPFTASVITTVATKNPKVGELCGEALSAISKAGAYKHDCLVEGYGSIQSTMYGLLIGASTFTVDYAIDFSSIGSSIGSSFMGRILKSGVEYASITKVQEIWTNLFKNGKCPNFFECTDEQKESFLMGCCMGFLVGSFKKIVIRDPNTNKVLDSLSKDEFEDLLPLLAESKTSILQTLKKSSPKLYSALMKGTITVDSSSGQAEDEIVIDNFNKYERLESINYEDLTEDQFASLMEKCLENSTKISVKGLTFTKNNKEIEFTRKEMYELGQKYKTSNLSIEDFLKKYASDKYNQLIGKKDKS